MLSEARSAANRRNAKLSTGPRTPEGKRKVSQNARTHGYRAVRQIITANQQQEIEKIIANFSQSNPPDSVARQVLLKQMGTAWWNIIEFDKQTQHLYLTTDYEYAISRLYTLQPYRIHHENLFYKALKALNAPAQKSHKQTQHGSLRCPPVKHEKEALFSEASSSEVGRTPGPRDTPSCRLREKPAMTRADGLRTETGKRAVPAGGAGWQFIRISQRLINPVTSALGNPIDTTNGRVPRFRQNLPAPWSIHSPASASRGQAA